jgi:PAS domain S-box-containing protein
VIVEASTVWIPEEDILVTILRDITDRKHSENEIQASRQLLGNIVESIHIGVWVGDKDFRITEWNAGQEKMTGITREEVIGLNIFERFPSLTNMGLEDMYRRVTETGDPLVLDNVSFYDDTLVRNRYVLNIKANALKDSNNDITGIVVAVEDITEQKLSEERFRMAALSCSDMIYEWDIESGHVEWFGDICAKLGYSPDEFPYNNRYVGRNAASR